MKAIKIIKIDTCSSCPFRILEDGGIGGSYSYCNKTNKDLTNFDHADQNTTDGKRDFPEWCPLEAYFEKR